jgi:hypothetical protein
MTECYYLNDHLYLQNGCTYLEEGSNKILVQKHNWHRCLKDIGWKKLPRKWITELNKLSTDKEKNSLYGILSCPGDGDCLFHSIANALNESQDFLSFNTGKDIRKEISESITEDAFDMIIECYRAMKDASDFHDSWDPHEITDLSQFKQCLCEGGHEYWGDSLLLQLISSYYDMNILILSNDVGPYPMMTEFHKEKPTICLWFDENHFELIGHFNGQRMISYFTTLPKEIQSLYNL